MNIGTTQSITIDVRSFNQLPVVTFIQQDNNVLNITVMDNGSPASLSGIGNILVNISRPDNQVFTHILPAPSGNTVTYTMSGDDQAVAGICTVEIQFYDSTNKIKLSSRTFKINLLKEVGAVTITNTSPQDTLLTQFLNQQGTMSNLQTTHTDTLVNAINDNVASLAESTQIKGTTQNVTFNSDGTVQKIQHVDSNNNVLREDDFTYTTNLITEVRTVGANTLTFKYHLDTLQTEVI